MTNPKVEVLPISKGATPDPSNVNKHTQKGGGLLENSLRRRGAFRSIASAGKGVETPVVYAGNYTLEKAVAAGFTEVVNVHVTGNQIVNVVRDDIEPGTAAAIALGIEDNEIGKQSYNPDIDILAALAAGDNAVLSALKQEDKTFGDMLEYMQPYNLDFREEWRGMPEFDNPPKAYKSISVHFETEKDYYEFCELMNQSMTEKTNSIWYPQRKRQDMKSIEYKNES